MTQAFRPSRGLAALAFTLLLLPLPVQAQAPATTAPAPLPALAGPGEAKPADPLTRRVKHGFTDSVYGQQHYLISQPEPGLPKSRWKTPLVLFHQSPLSAREFTPLIAEMGRDRVVIAFDTPGQGLSDGPDRPVVIADYALVMASSLKQLGYGGGKPVDIFGNHTGIWIAGELSIREPRLVRKLVLSGIYVVPETVWKGAIARLKMQETSAEFFEHMTTYLPRQREYYVSKGMSDADWGRLAASTLAPLGRREYAHLAAFSYTAEAATRLPMIKHPTTVLVVDDGIAEQTRGAVPLLGNVVKVVEHMEWKEGAFYTHTAEVAAALRQILD
jgi:pimeloyl-ACP methyl ester carboxylesterase